MIRKFNAIYDPRAARLMKSFPNVIVAKGQSEYNKAMKRIENRSILMFILRRTSILARTNQMK